MKDVYYNNFLKYATFIKSKSFESLADVMEEVSNIVIPKVDSEEHLLPPKTLIPLAKKIKKHWLCLDFLVMVRLPGLITGV